MDEFPLRDVANVKSALSVKNSRKKLLKSAFFPSNKELKKASRKQLVMRFTLCVDSFVLHADCGKPLDVELK